MGITKPKVVIRLSHMGDVALTTGVLAYWNEKQCESFVFITRAANAPLLENHPAVQEVIIVDDIMSSTPAWIKGSRKLAARFADHCLLDLHGTLRSRILSFLWKGPIQRYPKFGLTRRLYDRTHAEKYKKILEATNVTQRYFMAQGNKPPHPSDLVPRIFLKKEEKLAARRLLEGFDPEKPLVALHPYATHQAKQWPREQWHALTQDLEKLSFNWIVVGRDNTPLLSGHEQEFTNKTNLRETCALLAEADLLVTADSGPMHLACGVGTPVAALFGPTVKAWGFYPAGINDRVIEKDHPCRPCSLHGGKPCPKNFECMAGISPQEVMTNIQEMLAE